LCSFTVADCEIRVGTNRAVIGTASESDTELGRDREFQMTSQQLSVKVAINSWRLVLERTDKMFSNLTEEQLLKEVAPGKNRLIYLWGHLTASHDAMFPILGLGSRVHPETFSSLTQIKRRNSLLLMSSRNIGTR